MFIKGRDMLRDSFLIEGLLIFWGCLFDRRACRDSKVGLEI
jgi:hypothetical protein